MQIDLHIKLGGGGLENMAVKWEDTFCVKRGEDGKKQIKISYHWHVVCDKIQSA